MQVLEPKEIITTITNKKTGEKYKDEEALKAANIPPEDVQRDVRVIMPALDLFSKTKQYEILRRNTCSLTFNTRIIMAITDLQISDTLETSAPSIRYEGNEGPKSPEEQRMAQLQQEYMAYVFEQKEIGSPVMSFEEWYQMVYEASRMGVDAGQQPQGEMMRAPAAYGGIMDLGGRRRYGFGSIKKRIRKLIPNEVAQVAEVAAPFVAPFNPLAAGLMSGIGGFDRHGSIGKGLKSGLINYGVGQGARALAGAPMQQGFNLKINPGASRIGQYFSNPMTAAAATNTGVSGSVAEKGIPTSQGDYTIFGEKIKETGGGLKGLTDTIKKYALDPKILTGLAIGGIGAAGLMGNMKADEIQDLQRGEGLDIEGIRAEVIEAFKDESGEKLAGLRSKYPFLGKRDTKDTAAMAYGGRIGRAEGGIMDLGGMEKDYRNTGGFVDLGAKEKADDVPARLSVNEFVMTADAVRGAGGGAIDKGAEIMERVMENLEKGGRISEESQGLKGAQEMFEVSERLREVV